MKVFLKRVLPGWLWGFIIRGINFVFGISNRFISLLAVIFIRAVRFVVPRLLVEIKEHASIIVQMDYLPHKILLGADSIIEYTTRRNSCKKEPETVKWIETKIQPGDVIYDIGANVGAYSFVIDRHTGGKAKVYAFEPSFSTFAQLNKNVFLNSCQGRVIPIYIALANETKLSVLNYSSLTSGAALHALGRPIDHLGREFQPVFEQPILSFRIDDLTESFQVEKPNHIKLDVDGLEGEILKGAKKTLENHKLSTILVEMEPSLEKSGHIVDYLYSKGFVLEMIRSHGKSGLKTSNYLFVRE